MSATLAPFGFQPVWHPTGLDRGIAYTIASTYGTSIYKYDPVLLNTNGTITIGGTTGDLLGVFNGVEYTDATGKPTWSNYWPAATTATAITAWVWVDPQIVYQVQANGTVASTAVGDQANTGTYAGSTSTGLSATPLSSSLAGNGVQAQWRIVGLAPYADNAWGDAYTVLWVQIAQQQYTSNKVAV